MTAIAVLAPAEVARATIATHSKSFALASRLLPAGTRDEAAIVYTWCRRADDAVDEAEGGELAIARLRAELAEAYGGTAADPVLAAFGDVARDRAIPRSYPLALVAGLAQDVAGARYATVEDLFGYAWRVAGVVGLMMAHVFGVRDDAALVPAVHLGIAMQLTNVCRDVAEDWRRGRLYVPDELLAPRGAPGLARALGGPLPASARAPLAGAVAALLALAGRYYRSGDRGLAALPWRAALAVRAARSVYAAIGDRLARTGHDVTGPRAVVPRGAKLAKVAGAALRTLASLPRRALAVPVRTPARILEAGDVPRL